ncbi:PIN domain-containing protein [Geitlerinema splendidum]|nr:PIN domain-containing protein [Geitlerinema splendidum]
MNVYVESNFVLELALMQEQYESCSKLVELAESKHITLIIPAFSLAEPYETLIRAEKRRRRLSELSNEIRTELKQLERSQNHQQSISALQEEIGEFLVQSQEEEKQRLQTTLIQLLDLVEIIPLSSEVLRTAIHSQVNLSLSPQDSIVYSSILIYLQNLLEDKPNCFLNRNSKDFSNPTIIDELKGYNCRLLFRFDDGLGYIQSQI